ncbi:GNAT family N-acetyltransferase [Paenibacillus agricola]|uniref:GNAT family N-acetyltransferase n=1 Tax=Paenibacillus agricola TaxID=2716264 RepID=A0ABX0JDV3_9BACL|nr:GNAT family N-acetyltransferase [Paenibacillus agricola]NHN34619.1 GNAT family N-acetyltransferase [Paenibacillus agricola]
MHQISICKLDLLVHTAISHLVAESSKEGFRHMKRLVDEYESGTNLFDKQGEALFIACDDTRIIGIGGLNQSFTEQIGRVRRLYISQDYRKQGIGRMIMNHIIEEAKQHYQMIELKTDSPAGGKFYRSLGFSVKDGDEHVSHYLILDKA